MKFLQDLFLLQKKIKSSDLHLYVGFKPYLRGTDGGLYPIKNYTELTQEDTTHIAKFLLSDRQYENLINKWDFEYSAHLEKISRFRVNFFRDHRGISIVFRMINDEVISLDHLNIPPVVKNLAQEKTGLILVAGSNGSGKSTTVGGIINEINKTRNCNIVTIEDPIELLHQSEKSVISQREIGTHVKSFGATAKYLFRQDVNVVVVGEMRDFESFSLALDIAETGHLIISTIHASNASAVVSRIISSFPHDLQNLIRTKLALSLRAIISQKLLPMKDRYGRIPATEIVLPSTVVQHVIREGKEENIEQIIEAEREIGMRTFNDSLIELYANGKIDADYAISNSNRPEEMQDAIMSINNEKR